MNASPAINNCTFLNNAAAFEGGAIYSSGAQGSQILNCVFATNSAGTDGGAIASYSPLEVWNSSFVRNTSTQGGGAIMFNGFSLGAPLCQVFNSLFVGNSIDAPSAQGGAIDDFYANLDIENCTFTLNTCQAGSADAAGGGALFVSPYNDPLVVLGQASVGLELIEQLGEEPAALFVAVGGGGLISGIALAARERWPRTRIVGCVPAASPAMADAVAAGGRIVASRLEHTLSDATAGGIEEGAITVPICTALVDDWLAVAEEEIAAAMRIALLQYHVAAEGASGLALAGALRQAGGGGQCVAVLGGANAGATALEAVLHV